MPPPPIVFKENLSKQQLNTLNMLYQRMETIPQSRLNDPKTRTKFEALKTMYKEIAGENKLNAVELMHRIRMHENNSHQALFDLRSPDFFTRFFSLSSATKYAFNAIKKELQQDIDASPVPRTFQ